MISDFWKYHHPIHSHNKYIENLFFIFTFGEELLHKIPWKAFTFPSLTLHLVNDLWIYSYDLWHLFDKSHPFCFLPKDFIGIRCSYSEQNSALFDSGSHIFFIKGEALVRRIPKWRNSLDQLFINLNGKQYGYIPISGQESLFLFVTPTFSHIMYLVHPNILFF